ncbi:Reverse transcriptase [Theobroma cacao]|nr:Reverse transcriptase [Theobroma cacao]
MNLELKDLQDNRTWTIVPLPSNSHVIGCKWIYKVKLKANGEIERYKTRLVAKGYNQIPGFDYQETFNPVAKYSTVKVFFALVATNGWSLSQSNVNNVFLNGDLDEEVYIEIPQGYVVQEECPKGSKLVYELHKFLYGLKQASKKWNAKLTTSLLQFGFNQSLVDYSLFTMKTSITDFVALLRLEIMDIIEGISISQRKYTLDFLEEHGMLGAKPISTPIDYNHKLQKSQNGELLADPTGYRQLIGNLLYLTFSRPDITYAVQILSQFVDKPGQKHLVATHRVLKYLKNAPR